MKFVSLATAALAGAAAFFSPVARAGDVIVQISGTRGDAGSIGCTLFANEKGFPMDNSGARQEWVSPSRGIATCRFDKVAPGTYAIAIGHDLNGNRRVDTNFFGIPTEGWGVSQNVVPTLRPPRFDEAAFRVDGEAPVTVAVSLVY